MVALVAAIAGPIVISILYLVIASVLRDVTRAEGYARAALDMDTFVAYGLVLLAFVIAGTWKCRGPLARVLFALVAIAMSLVAMFVAFFAQMAP
jgi:hypothetical protein